MVDELSFVVPAGIVAPVLVTAVVGAGPAGLLFALAGRLLAARRGVDPAAWSILLFDKRDAYERTHRLRLVAAPFLALQREVADARFDDVVAFLRAEDFAPSVNDLEQRLARAVADVGVPRVRLHLGDGPGETSLVGLRERLVADGALRVGAPWTIVGADSVKSDVRRLAFPDARPRATTHQHVARLHVVGPGLPAKLGVVDQYKLSKALGSILDYRLNRNGFAEVDLFLSQREHAAVAALGAVPREPLPLDAARVGKVRAPLFRAIIEHLARGFGGGPCDVRLYSTFRLEHAVMPRRATTLPALDARAFLVGDAAVSLPFFRGMACLTRCAHALAQLHVDEVADCRADLTMRYEDAVEAIVRDELAVVAARARLVRGVREFMRVSALLPFPMQSWFLSADELERPRDRPTPGLAMNAAVAVAAAASAVLGVAPLAVALQVLGGVVYRAATTFERGPHRYVRAAWQAQVALLLVAGPMLAVQRGFASWTSFVVAAGGFLLGGAFVVGMLAFEALGRRWIARGALE